MLIPLHYCRHITRANKTDATDVAQVAPSAEFGRLEALFVYSESYARPPSRFRYLNQHIDSGYFKICLFVPCYYLCIVCLVKPVV